VLSTFKRLTFGQLRLEPAAQADLHRRKT